MLRLAPCEMRSLESIGGRSENTPDVAPAKVERRFERPSEPVRRVVQVDERDEVNERETDDDFVLPANSPRRSDQLPRKRGRDPIAVNDSPSTIRVAQSQRIPAAASPVGDNPSRGFADDEGRRGEPEVDPMDELLDDEPEPPTPTRAVDVQEPDPVAVSPKRRAPAPVVPVETSDTELMDDDGDLVDVQAASRKVSLSDGASASAIGMSREAIRNRLDRVKTSLSGGRSLSRGEAAFLQSVPATAKQDYREAKRLLGQYYFSLKQYRKVAEVLEVATKKGKYKHDPMILLSLAKSYGRLKRYKSAIKTMKRVERKWNRLSKKEKSSAYRFYAEMLEFEFLRQYNDDAKRAEFKLLSDSIRQWERYQQFNKGVSSGAVNEAKRRIAKLKDLKKDLEY